MSEAPEDTFELINALIRRLMEHEEPGRTIACGFRIVVKGVGNGQAGEDGIDPPDEEVETIGMNPGFPAIHNESDRPAPLLPPKSQSSFEIKAINLHLVMCNA